MISPFWAIHPFASSRTIRWVAAWLCLIGWIPVLAEDSSDRKPFDLAELSLEELMTIRVTLASRKPERVSETAAAVYVLTQEDIRRAGVTDVPEALRLVPGFMVGRIDANKWAVSCRGFMDLYANKLLLQVDGRSAYSPVFSGVFWEVQDLFLPDVDRIEVIRGPGASLWGANAVNGIINIVTKRAQDTQGGRVELGFGTEEQNHYAIRYGGKVGGRFAYRVYAKAFERRNSVFGDGSAARDGWSISRGGFRMDWTGDASESFTLQGDLYGGNVGSTISLPRLSIRGFSYDTPFSGGNMLGRWTRTFSAASEMILQFYFNGVARHDTVTIGGSYNTTDVDFQHRFQLSQRHTLVWGIGHRVTSDQIDMNPMVLFNPMQKRYGVTSAFIQDEAALARNRLKLLVGSKFEQNDFSGFEYQPSLRLLWKIREGRSVWAAASRAVRTPSRLEEDVLSILIQGNRNQLSEKLYAFELGCHFQASDRLVLDAAAYANRYRDLRSLEPIVFDNRLSARSLGWELAGDWHPCGGFRLRFGYTRCRIFMSLDPQSVYVLGLKAENESPPHQFTFHSSVDLPGRIEFDFSGRFVDKLASPSVGSVPAYFDLNVRLGAKPMTGVEVSLVGKNLLKSRHPEFLADWTVFAPTWVERSMTVSVSWTF